MGKRTGALGNAIPVLVRQRKIDPMTKCWLWTGAPSKGYGVIVVNNKNWIVSRFMATLMGWDIEGKLVLHRCDTPLCFNPLHLFVGTQQDNIDDAKAKGRACMPRQMCPNGHVYTPGNTLKRRHWNRCRICTIVRMRKHRAKRRQKELGG